MWNLVFLFTGLIFIILLLVIFLSKPKIKTKENKIFLILSILNLVGYIIEISLQIFVRKNGITYFIVTPLSKIYIVYIYIWFSIFSIYTFLISNSSGKLSDNSYKIIKYTHVTAIILGIIGIGIMPIKKYYSNGEMYTYGMSVDFLKIMLSVYIIVWVIRLLFNFKVVKEKKYYSIIITILLLFANVVIQSINPTILIATFTMTYTCYIIFFTIENPDIRMAKDLAFANDQVKKLKNNTINTLDDLSSKLQSSLSKLETFGYKKIDINNMEKDLRYIKRYCINFVDKFNGLIDISKISCGTFEVNESEYETINMINEINKMISLKSIEKLIIEKDKIPEVLYGDKDKIEQLILLVYKYLSLKGKIDIKFNYVNAGRFCKLKFCFITNNIDIEKYIYNVKGYGNRDNDFVFYDSKDNIEYDKIMKLTSLIDAKIEVNNNELVLSIYQRVKSPYKLIEEREENKGVRVKYFDCSDKRVLLVDDGVNDIREMLLLLKPYNINIDIAKKIEEIRKYLSSNKTYDLIFMDDVIYGANPEEYSIKKYKQVTGYDNFKSIIMLSNSNEESIDKYLENGYIDYIVKPLTKKNISEILKKYLK